MSLLPESKKISGTASEKFVQILQYSDEGTRIYVGSERSPVQQFKVLREMLGSYNFVFIIRHCHVDIKKDLICSLKQRKKVVRQNPFENKSL